MTPNAELSQQIVAALYEYLQGSGRTKAVSFSALLFESNDTTLADAITNAMEKGAVIPKLENGERRSLARRVFGDRREALAVEKSSAEIEQPKCNCKNCAVCGGEKMICGECEMCLHCHEHKKGCLSCPATTQGALRRHRADKKRCPSCNEPMPEGFSASGYCCEECEDWNN